MVYPDIWSLVLYVKFKCMECNGVQCTRPFGLSKIHRQDRCALLTVGDSQQLEPLGLLLPGIDLINTCNSQKKPADTKISLGP